MGKLYKVLNNVEMARQNAVRNAKAANLPASDDMSLLALSDLYRYQNNTEDIEIDSDKSQDEYFELWEEPEGWPDLKTILSEAEDIVDDNNFTYKPWLAVTIDARVPITKPLITNNATYFLLKTSDNQMLSGSTSAFTWDTLKDIHCSDGSVVRYIIIYARQDLPANHSMYYARFLNWPVLHIVYGAWKFTGFGTFQTTSGTTITNTCSNLKVIDCLPGCTITSPTSNNFSACESLRKVCVRFEEGYNMGAASNIGVNYQMFYNMKNLQEITLHNLVKCGTVGVTNSSYYGPFYNSVNCLQRVDLPDYEEGFLTIPCLTPGGKKLKNEVIVNTPKLKKVTAYPIAFNYNKKDVIDNTIEEAMYNLFTGINSSYFNGVETIKLTKLKSLQLNASSYLVPDWNDLKSLSLPSLETLTCLSSTTSTLIGGLYRDGIYVSLGSLNDFVVPRPLTSASKLTLDLPAVTNIDIYALTYSAGEYPKIKILAPNLKTIKLDNWGGSSSYIYATLELKHNNPIDFKLLKLTTSVNFGDAYGQLVDDNINTITIDGSNNIYNVGHLLLKSKFKKLVSTITDYSSGKTELSAYDYSQTNKKYIEPFIRDNIELDLGTGSTIDKHMGNWMDDDDFAKFFTNLIALPEGETRTLTLGTNLTKLSEETKAIATSKGWVLN